jgi:hypothetical protein
MLYRCSALTALLSFATLVPAFAGAPETKVYRSVSGEKLEKILKDLDIDATKSKGPKEGIFFYDFTRDKLKVRLHSYGGQDLWIESVFTDALTLEDVNRWNVRAKFSRAVLVKTEGKSSVSLECQLDCLGGVTDPIVRQFISRFDGELKDFVKFTTK